MKTILLAAAAALSLSGAAIAQSAQPSGETVDDPSQATGPQGVTQQGTDPNGMGSAPMGTNQPAPMGGYATPSPNQSASFAPRAATQDYPPCSRTVTDGCTQTYERGVRRSGRRR